MSPVVDITSQGQLDELCKSHAAVIVHFWADWAEPCKQMDVVLSQLATEHQQTGFARVEAEKAEALTSKFNVDTVPFCVILKNSAVVDTVEGANPPELASKVGLHVKSSGGAAPAARPSAAATVPSQTKEPAKASDEDIKKLLDSAPVLLFMKGNKDEPKCGFSSKVVSALIETGVAFETFDILKNEAIRQGLKVYSNWPTYPQLYVNSELIGGCDILLEMHAGGELKEVLEEGLAKSKQNLTQRITTLLQSAQILLFMKGSVAEPRCGFSKKTVAALQSTGLPFQTFDILQDEDIRQGLKEYSNWPTYPQLYVKGELLGGCDIILEMHESGELKETIQEMV